MVTRKPRKIFGAMGGAKWGSLNSQRTDGEKVYSKAKAEGVEIPFVELVTDPEPVPSTGGWVS